MIKIPMTFHETRDRYDVYVMPESHDGAPINPAVGRLVSGRTLCVPTGSPVPQATLAKPVEIYTGSKAEAWICVHF